MSSRPAARSSLKILVVDDDETVGALVRLHAAERGHEAVVRVGGMQLEKTLDSSFDVVLLDLLMPGMDGFECLRILRKVDARIPVIVLSSADCPEEVGEALRLGAVDFLSKPVDFNELFRTLEAAALSSTTKIGENSVGISSESDQRLRCILGDGESAKRLFDQIRRVADSDSPVLIHGETGVGKTLVARSIHLQGVHGNGPFVTVSCPGLRWESLVMEMADSSPEEISKVPGTMFEKIALAAGGTLFLDEVGELSPLIQAKLLGFFDEQTSMRAGAEAGPRRVRIISSSSTDLGKRVREGSFRADLYHRMNVLSLRLPPLRERAEDIPALLKYLSVCITDRSGRSRKVDFDEEALDLMRSYRWPGNVRELENVVEHIVTFSEGGRVTSSDLPSEIREQEPHGVRESPNLRLANIPLRELEEMAVLQTLESNDGSRKKSARRLGVSEKTVYNILKRHQS